MSNPYTLQYGTYAFPNQTFELIGHKLMMDTPSSPIRRKDGGVSLDGNMLPKKFQINGKVFANDIDTLHATQNILQRALHNKGQEAFLQYRADRRILCRLAPEGIDAPYEKGLYQYVANLNIVLLAKNPLAESTTLRTGSGTRNNASGGDSVVNQGTAVTYPLFTFVSGHTFFNNLSVVNNTNGMSFGWQGTLVNGQTLIIDCDAGCVLLQSGTSFIDAISYFYGDLFFAIESGGTNSLTLAGGTYSYSILSRDRYYL